MELKNPVKKDKLLLNLHFLKLLLQLMELKNPAKKGKL